MPLGKRVETQAKITRAYWDLGDFLSRLGGAERPRDMYESDISLYICCLIARQGSLGNEDFMYLSPRFLSSFKPIQQKIDDQIESLELSSDKEELISLIGGFVESVDSRYKEQHRSPNWIKLIEWLHLNQKT